MEFLRNKLKKLTTVIVFQYCFAASGWHDKKKNKEKYYKVPDKKLYAFLDDKIKYLQSLMYNSKICAKIKYKILWDVTLFTITI